MFEYKNYLGHFEYDNEAETFHGRVIGIRDMVTFQGSSVAELKQSFHDSVDDYLDFCKENGDEPNKPFSGKFLLRISPDLHRNLDLLAAKKGTSMNSLIIEILNNNIEEINTKTPVTKSKSSTKIKAKSRKKTVTK